MNETEKIDACFFKHIDPAFPKDNCEKCQMLFVEKCEEQELQQLK